MVEVAAIVEGQTEQAFIRTVLQPHLVLKGINIWARLPGRVYRRGGVRHWESVRGDIERTLRESNARVVTTMFDFYGMPANWPGRTDASPLPWEKKGRLVEDALAGDIQARMGVDFAPGRFIPYVQVHEFETILFSDITSLHSVLKGMRNYPSLETLRKIVAEAGTPEAINDSPRSAPSKRLAGMAPGYQKRLHGVIAAERIGLETIRNGCPNFDRWLTSLEQLA